jgi:glucokinase
MAEAMLLVGDIGGTQARLALLPDGGSFATPIRQAIFPSQEYAGLEPLVSAFLGGGPSGVSRAVFAVAGPVVNRRAELTNLPWILDEQALSVSLGTGSVRLLNDLHALAYALPHLGPEAFHPIQRGTPVPDGVIAIIAPGTGLGEAYLTRDGGLDRAYASEGGHADFAPTDELQMELLQWLQPRVGHVSCERVCSGRGLPDLYRFLQQRGGMAETGAVAARLADAADPGPIIIDAATDPTAPSPLCTATLELFADILAAEAGNVALRLLATGGIFLGGGLPRRLLGILGRDTFLQRFRGKGRLASFLDRIPLNVVVRRHVALLGAMHFALTADTGGAP